jgi:hypothetical protein
MLWVAAAGECLKAAHLGTGTPPGSKPAKEAEQSATELRPGFHFHVQRRLVRPSPHGVKPQRSPVRNTNPFLDGPYAQGLTHSFPQVKDRSRLDLAPSLGIHGPDGHAT